MFSQDERSLPRELLVCPVADRAAAGVIRAGDVPNAATFFGLPERTLERWYYAWVERRRQQAEESEIPIRTMGLDELSLKKQGDYVAVIIDQTHGRVLEVLPGREKETVSDWLRANRDSGRLMSLEEVTTDMDSGFTEAVRLVIDRFHVMKNFQDRLEKARREIQQRLPPKAAKGLKGLRWMFITNPENLSPQQRQELEELKDLYPELGWLHDLRERLRRLFDDRRLRRPETATAHLRAWIAEAKRTGLKAVETFCGTLENWMEGIANDFVNRSTGGPTESLNQGLRTILRRAFGLTKFEHFRLRALDAYGRA